MKRPEIILEHLERRGALSYPELAELLSVSTMTARREIDRLAAQKLVIKTPGGAQRPTAPAGYYETDLTSRLNQNVAQKRAIALCAVELIAPDQTVFLDPGTTCLELAKLLAKRRAGLTLVTNSALACLELGRGNGGPIIGLGGQYDVASASFFGPACEEAAERFFVDWAFVSTKAFLPAEGTFESAVETIRIKQVVARRCKRLVLLADHSKFGVRALCKALDSHQIDTVITDSRTGRPQLEELERAGKTVLVAEAAAVLTAEALHAS
jgi:DeoR/GlpR family transcriptional regulator of sugar metabolism